MPGIGNFGIFLQKIGRKVPGDAPFAGWAVEDLTHSLDETVPTWSGGCGFHLDVKLDYDQGLRVQSLKSHAGVGTHVDAPSHFMKGGKNVGDLSLKELLVPLCVLDVTEEMDEDFFIEKSHILAFEKKTGPIPKGALFAAYTGWEKFWKEPQKYRNVKADGKMHFPGFSEEAALFLLEKGISGIAIDTLSPDGSRNGQGAHHYLVHLAILGQGKYIIENVANLSRMKPHGFAICLPPKAALATESACRLVGLKKE